MNLILAFIQFILIFLIVMIEYRNGSVVIILWATLLVMFGIPHFVAVLTETFIYPQYVYIYASIFVILFNLIYLLSRFILKIMFRNYNVVNSIRVGINNNTLNMMNKESGRIFKTLIFIFSVSIISIIRECGSILNTSWGAFYSNSIDIYEIGFNIKSISYFTKYIIFASGGLLTYFFYKKQYVKSFIVAGIILSNVIISRNRIMILPLFTSVILMYLLKYRKLRFKQIILYGVLGFFIIYIVYALRLFRHYGDLRNFISAFEFSQFNQRLFEMLLNNDGELGLRNVFLYFIYKDNNFLNFNKGHTYLRLIFMFIPTKYSFGLKPPDFAITMGSAWLGDFSNTRFSTHPTLYGDVFANFYWFGIILAIFWAIFALIIDRIIINNCLLKQLNYISIFGSMYVIIGRGSVYNGIFIGVLSAIILNIIYFIYYKIPLIKFKKLLKRRT